MSYISYWGANDTHTLEHRKQAEDAVEAVTLAEEQKEDEKLVEKA